MELQRPKGSFQVSDLGLEIIYRLSDGHLQFGGLGPGWRVVSDLDNGGHGDYFCELVGRAGGMQGRYATINCRPSINFKSNLR